jgi:hypothetical protein
MHVSVMIPPGSEASPLGCMLSFATVLHLAGNVYKADMLVALPAPIALGCQRAVKQAPLDGEELIFMGTSPHCGSSVRIGLKISR